MLLVVAVLFGCFTAFMLLDQLAMIGNNVTTVDRAKGRYINTEGLPRARHTSWTGLYRVCGAPRGRFSWTWLVPLAPRFESEAARADVLGYLEPGMEGHGESKGLADQLRRERVARVEAERAARGEAGSGAGAEMVGAGARQRAKAEEGKEAGSGPGVTVGHQGLEAGVGER